MDIGYIYAVEVITFSNIFLYTMYLYLLTFLFIITEKIKTTHLRRRTERNVITD